MPAMGYQISLNSLKIRVEAFLMPETGIAEMMPSFFYS